MYHKATVSFRAMGSDCNVAVFMRPDFPETLCENLAAVARERVAILEQAWSRFRDDSEISMLNRRDEGWVALSHDTFTLISRMLDAHWLTDKAYNPGVYDAMQSLGYSTSFDEIPWIEGLRPVPTEVPDMSLIQLDEANRSILKHPGLRLDPGGIGKGLAADIVAREIWEAGATGIIVDIGGDLSVRGEIPGGRNWAIEVSPRCHSALTLTFSGGRDLQAGICTSGIRTRQWGEYLFHIVDPGTGLPASTSIQEVTVKAQSGWLAEAHTKAALLADIAAPAYFSRHSLSGALFHEEGMTSIFVDGELVQNGVLT